MNLLEQATREALFYSIFGLCGSVSKGCTNALEVQ